MVVHVQNKPSEQVLPLAQGIVGVAGQYQPSDVAWAERPATIASRRMAAKNATFRIGE